MRAIPPLWLGWGVCLGLGIAVRAAYLVTPGLDSDMAIVGLMGRHILHGEFPVFFWGQPFAGTAESYLAAVLFFLFGASRLTLGLSPFLVSLAFLLVTYRLGREAFDSEVGLLALLLAVLPAPFLVTHSVTARANYIENLVLGSVILTLALRLGRAPDPRLARQAVLFGFLAGVAWYQSPQSVHYLVAAGVFVLLEAPGLVRHRGAWTVVPGFALGSLPFWASTMGPGATVHAIRAQASFDGLGASASRYAAEKLPYVLGATTRHGTLVLPLGVLALGLHALALLHLVGRIRLPGSRLLLIFLLTTSAILVFGYNESGGMRYLLPLYSAIPIVTAAFVATLRRRSRILAVAVLGALLALHVSGTAARAAIFDQKARDLYAWRRARDARLVEWLVADGLTRLYVRGFWEAYRLTFDAGERVIFAEPGQSFYPPYTHMVDTAARYGYLVHEQGVAGSWEENLRAVGGGYRRRDVVGYTVFDGFVPPTDAGLRPIPSDGWRAEATHDGAGTGRAFDGDPSTAWRTGPLAGAPASYQLDLGAVRTLGQLALVPASPGEAPRGFRLDVSVDGERWTPALTLMAGWRGLVWDGGRLRLEEASPIHVRFQPMPARLLRVVLLRPAEMRAWSIAELMVWEVGT